MQLQTPLFFYMQVAVKNSIDVFYFSCMIPMHVLFMEDGEMEKRVFLATWKDIPAANEVQSDIRDVQHNAGIYCVLLNVSGKAQILNLGLDASLISISSKRNLRIIDFSW